MERIRHAAVTTLYLSMAAVLAAAAMILVSVWPHVHATAWNFRNASWELSGLSTKLHHDYVGGPGEESYSAMIQSNLESSAAISRQTYEAVLDTRALISDSRKALFGPSGLVPEATALLVETRTAVSQIAELIAQTQTDFHIIATSANSALAPLERSLANIASLTATLDEQVKAGSPQALEALRSLDVAIDDFARLLEDPNIQRSLANIEGITANGNDAMESVATALRPWRKRAGQLKAAVKFAAEIAAKFFSFVYAFGR
jgi:hypothetical protein